MAGCFADDIWFSQCNNGHHQCLFDVLGLKRVNYYLIPGHGGLSCRLPTFGNSQDITPSSIWQPSLEFPTITMRVPPSTVHPGGSRYAKHPAADPPHSHCVGADWCHCIFYGDFGMIYGIVGDIGILYPTTDVIDIFLPNLQTAW